jgi:hypothetical protein
MFNHDVTSKNGVVVVIGTSDGQTVAWSRAFTGMPLGNEQLLVVLRDKLNGLPLTPQALIGPAQSRRTPATVIRPPELQAGALERLLWGLDDSSTRFARVKMKGDKGQGGFLYLNNEIQLTGGQKWGVFIFTFLACLAVWLVFALRGQQAGRSRYSY